MAYGYPEWLNVLQQGLQEAGQERQWTFIYRFLWEKSAEVWFIFACFFCLASQIAISMRFASSSHGQALVAWKHHQQGNVGPGQRHVILLAMKVDVSRCNSFQFCCQRATTVNMGGYNRNLAKHSHDTTRNSCFITGVCRIHGRALRIVFHKVIMFPSRYVVLIKTGLQSCGIQDECWVMKCGMQNENNTLLFASSSWKPVFLDKTL